MPNYNVLDVVSIRSQMVLRELEGFETDSLDGEDIVITNGSGFRFAPRFDRRVFGGGSYASYVEHLGSVGATVSLRTEKKIEVNVNWLLKYSNAVLYVNVVEPLLRLVFASKGYALLHSACLSRTDKAILFSAPPDTGKTTTVLKCLDKAWFSFMSDDMTVIGPDLSVHEFPKPFTISAHTYNSMINDDDLRVKDVKRKLKLRVKSLVHSRTGRRILRLIGQLNIPILTVNAIGQMAIKPPKVFVEDLVAGVTSQSRATPVAICLLRRGGGEKIVPMTPEDTLGELMYNSEDAFGFPPYSDIFHHLKLYGRPSSEILADERTLLSRLVKSVRCFRLHSDSRRWDLLIGKVMDEMVKPVTGPASPLTAEPIVYVR